MRTSEKVSGTRVEREERMVAEMTSNSGAPDGVGANSKVERMRRRSTIFFSEEDIIRLLALPGDVGVVGIWADPARNGITVGLQCDDWQPVDLGSEAPRLLGHWESTTEYDNRFDEMGATYWRWVSDAD